MAMTYQQAIQLLKSVSSAVPDPLDCDGCFEMIAELADAERRGDELSSALQGVRIHLSQCPCCAYEYEAMLEAIEVTNI
jgi:hypothetical protein